MATPTTPSSARWREVAARVADELRPGASSATVRRLRSRRSRCCAPPGLANLVIPARVRRHGAHWETAFDGDPHLSRADASLGQILGYHYLNQACMAFYGDPADRERWYRASVDGTWSGVMPSTR